jgi:hypothetical protein
VCLKNNSQLNIFTFFLFYSRWGSASKELTLDQVTDILNGYRTTCNWKKAMEYLPQRKLHANQHQTSNQFKKKYNY